ncbi:MAG: peptide chain release factor family protein, partial [Burkholderiales bacterium]
MTRPPYSIDRDALETEVRIDTFRAAVPGGQHVNKTYAADSLPHLPAGVVVIALDSPAQFRKN